MPAHAQVSALSATAPPLPRTRLIAGLLPEGIVTVECGTAADTRQRSFEAGRRCAALAAAELGCDGSAIGVCADRRPHWPAGFTGSITHTDGFAAAAMAGTDRYAAIGIDVERTGRLTSDLWRRIMVRSELAWLRALPVSRQAIMATVVFSAKESFYKAQFELVQEWLEFHDVAVDFTPGGETLAIVPDPARRLARRYPDPVPVRYAVEGTRVATAVAISAI